jgi:hypothetical protein
VQVYPGGARLDRAGLGPFQQRPANALAACFGQKADIDNSPARRRAVEIEPADRRARTQRRRAFHDPEVGTGKITDEVMVLQAELIAEKRVLLRLRPRYGCHLLRPEAREQRLQERHIRCIGIPQRQAQRGKLIGQHRLRRRGWWKRGMDGQRR